MTELPAELRMALDATLAGIPAKELAGAVTTLIDRYRSGHEAAEPILASATSAAAYAAYRMPATYAAVKSVLTQFSLLTQGFHPSSQVDIGGGTGAALWAAAEIWPTLQSIDVLEGAGDVIKLGKLLAQQSASTAVRTATWSRITLNSQTSVPHADLITMCYVLGELPERHRAPLVRELASRGQVVALVEPGTPAGYQRIIAARTVLLEAGMSVAAPCPHNKTCPITQDDWCHFADRISRTSLHRRIKGGSLGYEDEKFSYVVATRLPHTQPESRIIRHPQRRKGLVNLTLCRDSGELAAETISQRQGDRYRRAKDVSWGNAWS